MAKFAKDINSIIKEYGKIISNHIITKEILEIISYKIMSQTI